MLGVCCSNIILCEEEEEMQRVAQICACSEGGGVSSAARQPQPPRSAWEKCQSCRSASTLRRAAAESSSVFPPHGSTKASGHRIVSSLQAHMHAQLHQCEPQKSHTLISLHTRSSLQEWIFSGPPHQVTMSRADTL